MPECIKYLPNYGMQDHMTAIYSQPYLAYYDIYQINLLPTIGINQGIMGHTMSVEKRRDRSHYLPFDILVVHIPAVTHKNKLCGDSIF